MEASKNTNVLAAEREARWFSNVPIVILCGNWTLKAEKYRPAEEVRKCYTKGYMTPTGCFN